MADENTTYDTSSAQAWLSNSEYADPSFIQGYEGGMQQLVLDAQSEDGRKKISEKFETYSSEKTAKPKSNMKVGQNTSEGEEKSNIAIQQQPKTTENDWIKDKRDSWQPWCEKEHTPPYIYDENQEVKDGLKFDVYKNEADKAAGKKAASIHYKSKQEVVIEDVPDYEFFDKLAKEAKKDGIPGITFDSEMTPDFKARLAAACVANGLKMENGPEMIDANQLGNVSGDLKKQVETFNKTQEYSKVYEQAKQDAEKFDKTQSFSLKDEKDPAKAAVLYAAYANAGIKVSDAYSATKDNGGYFNTDYLGFMSDKEKEPLTKYNGKQKQIDEVRNKVHAQAKAALKNGKTSEADKKLITERQKTEKARAAKRAGKELTEEDKQHLGAARAQTRSDLGVKMTDEQGEKTHLNVSLLKKMRETQAQK